MVDVVLAVVVVLVVMIMVVVLVVMIMVVVLGSDDHGCCTRSDDHGRCTRSDDRASQFYVRVYLSVHRPSVGLAVYLTVCLSMIFAEASWAYGRWVNQSVCPIFGVLYHRATYAVYTTCLTKNKAVYTATSLLENRKAKA